MERERDRERINCLEVRRAVTSMALNRVIKEDDCSPGVASGIRSRQQDGRSFEKTSAD